MANSRDRCEFKKNTLYFLASSKRLKDVLQFKELILKSCEIIVQKRTWAEEAANELVSHSQGMLVILSAKRQMHKPVIVVLVCSFNIQLIPTGLHCDVD